MARLAEKPDKIGASQPPICVLTSCTFVATLPLMMILNDNSSGGLFSPTTPLILGQVSYVLLIFADEYSRYIPAEQLVRWGETTRQIQFLFPLVDYWRCI